MIFSSHSFLCAGSRYNLPRNDRGEEKGEEASTYILRRDDAGNLKLHVALIRGASTPD